ncbi:hypothetical protein [Algoriphagus sp. C2-6-M1]|uniref:ATP dependent DNA ligase n=1 Tax=Algoriphagus persicinus TaxID=3108754 RepID=UPI003A5CBD8B
MLILGLRKKDELVYVGNCGTGFSIALQKELISQFVKIKQPKSSFAEKINLNGREPVWLHPIKMTSQFLRLWIGLKSIRTFLKKCSVMKSV